MLLIEDLPNELIYRIFDLIDINSIISFSLTCKRFFQCLNGYQNCQMNFESIRKDQYDLIVHLINPTNVQSLILSDDDSTPGQIKAFLNKSKLNQFNLLKSLKLIQINENDLESILKHFQKNCLLNSFHIEYRQYFTLLNSSTMLLLNQILSFDNLRNVHLDMRSYQNEFLFWPQTNQIKQISLIHLNVNQFIQIIQKTNQFEKILLKKLNMENLNKISMDSKLIHLKDFRIEQTELVIEDFEYLISLMNKLITLKLEGQTNTIDKLFRNNQLEHLFQTKLIYLQKFEVFIRFSPREKLSKDFVNQLFSEQLNRSYWISHLNSSIHCNYIQTSNEIHLYSLPCLNHYFNYSDTMDFISSSSANIQYQRFNSIYHLDLNLKDLNTSSTHRENCSNDHLLFPNLTSLKLTLNDQCSLNCFEYLSKVVNFKQIVQMVLIISSRGCYLNSMMNKFLNILKDFSELNSLEIFNRWHGIFSIVDINTFCSIVPLRLKHLDIDLFDLNHIQILIQNLKNLTSLKLKYSFEKSLFIKDILEWFKDNHINMTYILDIHYLSIWISQKSNKKLSNKRIKISH